MTLEARPWVVNFQAVAAPRKLFFRVKRFLVLDVCFFVGFRTFYLDVGWFFPFFFAFRTTLFSVGHGLGDKFAI